MKIVILTVGSRGDVQPYVALGQGLRSAGHQVCLVAHETYRPLIEEHGLTIYPMQGDPQASLQEEAGFAWLEATSNPITFVRRMLAVARPIMEQILEDYLAASREADLIIYPVLATLVALSIAEKNGIRALPAYLQPVHPTSAFPFSLLAPRIHLGPIVNRATHWLSSQIFWAFTRPLVNGWRAERLGLPSYPLKSPFMALLAQQPLCLYGFSAEVVPKPTDWPASAQIPGYWSLDRRPEWKPEPGLVDFLAAGAPPVYVGFGSMVNRDPELVTSMAIEALTRSRQRGLLLHGWGGLQQRDLPDHIFAVNAVPHDWLFPRMAAIVHHGGMGTTGAALRAGVPSIVVPFFADQPFWADRVQRLGVGPAPIPRRHLSAERLAAAIEEAVTNQSMQDRARKLGKRLQEEDGVGNALRLFQATLSQEQRPASK